MKYTATPVQTAARHDREVRTFGLQIGVENRADGPPMMVGYAALFDSPSQDLGGFVERIAHGAFTRAIHQDDVRALFNHNPDRILGRNKSGTLRMSEDGTGLRVEIDPPDAQWARDLMSSMARGDIDQMSFGFSVDDDQWEKRDGKTVRTLKAVSLYDVSPVTYPAYLDTSIALRSMKSWDESEEIKHAAKYRTDLARVNLKRRLLLD
jgi:HK97 family phage prohead protease